ncbi:hypothetical protein [Brasilonema sp. UFV-L1]|uniref:phage portal protein family protein n=1 Tax=Brasilonema sp. UFV-L1 TaxID=2234130 RepID=UPI00145EE795|nr:hypothetical protein [Brasilonema sp. UFV-L1]NMG10707.1 hypothetical protein [Brasilonema sp. UFV-L1]
MTDSLTYQISAQLMQRELAAEIEGIFTSFAQNLTYKEDYSLEDLAKMLKECPINRVAISITALRALTEFGEYFHNDTHTYQTPNGPMTITQWVRSNFESMKGSLHTIIGKMIKQAYSLGTSCAEIVWTAQKGEWRLHKIKILNPLHYSFTGSTNKIDNIIYKKSSPSKLIPYQKLIHIYNPSIEEPDDPQGDPQAARAYPYFQARQLFFKQWTTAGQRQATGLLVVQAPGDKMVAILNAQGEPVKKEDGSLKTQNAIYATVSAAQNAENRSVFGTDIKNKVFQIPGNAGEKFFEVALQHYQKMVFYSYGVPSTIFDDTASGIGNAGINEGHRLILDSQIEAIMTSTRDEILEKVVKPLLIVNFGKKFENNLGEFKVEKEIDPAAMNARVLSLSLAMSNGIISTKDLEAVNKLREDLGLSALSKEEFRMQALNQ